MTQLIDLIQYAIKKNASDLHITPGHSVHVRKLGKILAVTDIPIPNDPDIIFNLLDHKQKERFQTESELEDCLYIPGLGRFRYSIFKQQNGLISAAFRLLSLNVPALQSLGFPQSAYKLCMLNQGLILFTGSTNSGKTTTMAAFIDHINQNQNVHIITIEDPIEYLFNNQKAVINQRQVGKHTESFQSALKAALHEDPDIIVVGEIRDLETFSLALTAAETGHLVLGTVHTRNSMSTINRIVDTFPSEDQDQIKTMLAESLKAILSQILVPSIEENQLVAIYEYMVNNTSIANAIRENKTYQIPTLIQLGQKKFGMCSLKDSLKELKDKKLISHETFDQYVSQLE